MTRAAEHIKAGKPFRLFDLIVYAVVLAAAIFSIILLLQPKGATARISVDGTVVAELSLFNDIEKTYSCTGGEFEVVIKDGAVHIAENTCIEHICVKSGAISRVGSRIICIPNKVIIEVVGDGGVEATT